MSTEQQPYAAASPAAATPALKPKPRFDPRYIAPLLITCVLIGAHVSIGALESPQRTGLAIVSAMLTEIVLGLIFTRKIPHLASAYVTGISVGILVRSPFYWPYALCSVLSIMSKYVLRVDNRHIWNPSNFGISAMAFLAPAVVATLSIQFGNSIRPMILIWFLGAFIIWRLKRFHICATYVLSFGALAGLRAAMVGDCSWVLPIAWAVTTALAVSMILARSLAPQVRIGSVLSALAVTTWITWRWASGGWIAEFAPITGPPYQLFTFFMITDPKTTVSSRGGQVASAVTIAVVESLLRGMQAYHGPLYRGHEELVMDLGIHAPYYALFLVGPVFNLVEIYRARRAKQAGAGATVANPGILKP